MDFDLVSIDVRLQTIVWYSSHAILFVWFALFITPSKNSDRANVMYFWGVSFMTLLLLISSICHIPRLFNSDASLLLDVVSFSWTVLPLAGFSVEILSRVSRRITGYSFASPLRAILSNTLLVTIALSIQYMTCLESGFLRSDAKIRRSVGLNIPYMHCAMLESPRYVAIPIALTVIALFVMSELSSVLLGSSFKFFQSRHKRHGTGWFDKSSGDQSPQPVQTPMVPWFSLSLTTTAIQLLVSLKVFVGRLDIRHILTAVCKDDGDIVFDLRSQEGSIDFLADGGDGFNSSYSVARMLAQPNLAVKVPRNLKNKPGGSKMSGKSSSVKKPGTPKFDDNSSSVSSASHHSSLVQRRITNPPPAIVSGDSAISLPRGAVVVHGGDLVYPRPSSQTYRTRLLGPLEAALPAGPGGNRPRMFLIPGNHDHYDGLESFVRWILGSSCIGGWKLPQRSSYFALCLKEGWWILGLDVGLTEDLDVFQYQIFCQIIDERIAKDDRVIVLSHRPQWVSDPYSGKSTGDLFHQIIEKIGNNRLAMRLAGDLHHYMRFDGPGLAPLVTSGGGGAFLHPTHTLDASLVSHYFASLKRNLTPDLSSDTDDDDDDEEDDHGRRAVESKVSVSKVEKAPVYLKVSSFPEELESKKLAWLNLLKFRDKNWGADIIFGTLYCCMTVSLLPICNTHSVVKTIGKFASSHSLIESLSFGLIEIFVDMIIPAFKQVYFDSTFSLLSHILFFALCYAGAQGKRGSEKNRIMIAITHYIVHAFAAIAVVCLIELGIEVLSLFAKGRDSVVSDPFRIPGLVRALDASFDANIGESTLKIFLRFMDFPSSLIRNRQPICVADNTRELLFRYIWRVLPFVWLLATPTAAKIMGSYLFLSINYLGLHLNESFSSLRIEDYKHFLRMRIDPDSGDLHVYVIGLELVPKDWEQDPAWDPLLFEAVPGSSLPPSSKWVTPSRWRPKSPAKEDPVLVDYFVVPRRCHI